MAICYRRRSVVCSSVYMYVGCHTRAAAKAVGRNEMPLSRDTRVVPSNIILDRSPGAPQKGEIWGRNATSQRCCLIRNYFGIVILFHRQAVRYCVVAIFSQ